MNVLVCLNRHRVCYRSLSRRVYSSPTSSEARVVLVRIAGILVCFGAVYVGILSQSSKSELFLALEEALLSFYQHSIHGNDRV